LRLGPTFVAAAATRIRVVQPLSNPQSFWLNTRSAAEEKMTEQVSCLSTISTPTIGFIIPPASDETPEEALRMYPAGVHFRTRGLGLGRLTPDGYDSVIGKVAELSRELAGSGAQAIALLGTSLSFYQGPTFNERLTAGMKEATELPCVTMSTAVVEALRACGARRIAVGTAYIDEVNKRLHDFLTYSGFDVLALQGLGITDINDVRTVGDDDLVALGEKVFRAAPGAEAVLMSCGGLRTLDMTLPLERRIGVPVVSSMPAALWAAMRLIGADARAPGFGRLLEGQARAA
jgi:arylmalonate decarboxylase